MNSDQPLFDVPADISAHRIDREDIPVDQKGEKALRLGFPILDPEVKPTMMRWVKEADDLKLQSPAIEQIREMLDYDAAHGKKRAGKIKATPILKQPIWDKLLSE